MVARANAHIRYPCRFLLIAAANPCKCGYLSDPNRACGRAPHCGEDYLGRVSGPLLDRFDLRLEVPPVTVDELALPASGEGSDAVAERVAAARAVQAARFAGQDGVRVNADLEGTALEEIAAPDAEGKALLDRVAEKFRLSARGYHRVLRVARTIADLEGGNGGGGTPCGRGGQLPRPDRRLIERCADKPPRLGDRCVGLGQPAAKDRPDMRGVRPHIDGHRAARRAQPIGHALRIVAQHLASRGLQEDRRRVREIGVKRRGARVARIGPRRYQPSGSAFDLAGNRASRPAFSTMLAPVRARSVSGDRAISPAGCAPPRASRCASSASASPPPALSPPSTMRPGA
jgi:hypothetical protein